MRTLLIVVSLLALAFLAVELHRAPNTFISRSCVPWIAAQTVFVGFGLFALNRFGKSSLLYMTFFYGMMAVIVICAMLVTVAFLTDFPKWTYAVLFAYSVFSFASGLTGIFLLLLARTNMLSRFSAAHVVCCSSFLFCGICGMTSMLFSTHPTDGAIRFWLSLFWILIGIFGLVDSGLYVRQKHAAMSLFENAPVVFAIVAFLMLAFSLRSHREATRQPLPEISMIDSYAARLRSAIVVRKAR